jgi:hypothetical protein
MVPDVSDSGKTDDPKTKQLVLYQVKGSKEKVLEITKRSVLGAF